MSKRYNNGSHYENHQAAAEMHDLAAHAHLAAGSHGQQDHLSPHERTREAMEYSRNAHSGGHTGFEGHRHEAETPGHAKIAARAYQLWEARGCPQGSPDEDWFGAAEALKKQR